MPERITLQAVRDGYRRFGRAWTLTPELVEVRAFDPRLDRPAPEVGVWVISPAEFATLAAYSETPNAQLRWREPAVETLVRSEEAAELAELAKKRDHIAAEVSALERTRAEAAAKVDALTAEQQSLEQLAVKAEERARAADQAAARAEEQLKETQEALDELQAQQSSRRKKAR